MKVTVLDQTEAVERKLEFPLIARFHSDDTIVLFTSPVEGTHLFIGSPHTIGLTTCYCSIGEYSDKMKDINAKNMANGYQWEILDDVTLNFKTKES